MEHTNRSQRRVAPIAIVVLLVAAMAPASASAAQSLSFGTVSIGSTKTLNTTVPLTRRLSELPPDTVIYTGGVSSIDQAVAFAFMTLPVTAGSLLAKAGQVTVNYNLGQNFSSPDYDADSEACLTGTASCNVAVTFAPIAAGTRTGVIRWAMLNVQVISSGSYDNLVQQLSQFLATAVRDTLEVNLDGNGVPSTGSVSAQVDIASSAACIQLSTATVDFGSLALGDMDKPASPTISVTNCSSVGETLYARGSNAAGESAAWSLTDDGSTCADTLGLDRYRMSLATALLPVPLALSTSNKEVQSLAAGEVTDHVARIWTACPGSTGGGVVMTMDIHYLVTGS